MRRHYNDVLVIVIIRHIGIKILVGSLTNIAFEIPVYVGVLFVITLHIGMLASGTVPMMGFVCYPRVGIEGMLMTVIPGALVAEDISVLVNVRFFVFRFYAVTAGGFVPVVLGIVRMNFTVCVVAELISTNVTNTVVVFFIGVRCKILFLCRMSAC